GERRAALASVASSVLAVPLDLWRVRLVGAPRADAVGARLASGAERRSLVPLDVAAHEPETRLHVLGERPVRQAAQVVQPMNEAVQREQAAASEGADHDAEGAAADDRIELIAVQDEQASPVGGRMDRFARDLDVAELHARERAQVVVVIARDVDDARAFAALLQNELQDFRVARRPVEIPAQALEV